MQRVGVPTMLQSCGISKDHDIEYWAAASPQENMDEEEELYGGEGCGERGRSDEHSADMLDSILRDCMRGGAAADYYTGAAAAEEEENELKSRIGRDYNYEVTRSSWWWPWKLKSGGAVDLEETTSTSEKLHGHSHGQQKQQQLLPIPWRPITSYAAGAEAADLEEAEIRLLQQQQQQQQELLLGCDQLEPSSSSRCSRYAGPTLTDIESALMAMDGGGGRGHSNFSPQHPADLLLLQQQPPPSSPALVHDAGSDALVWGSAGFCCSVSRLWSDTDTDTDPSAADAAPAAHHPNLMMHHHHHHLGMNNHLITSPRLLPFTSSGSPSTTFPPAANHLNPPHAFVQHSNVAINNSSSTANVTTQAIKYYRKSGKIDPCWDSSNWRLRLLKRSNLEPKYTVKVGTEAEAIGDGYKWRKYGQKNIKNCSFPRSYYKCSAANCNAKKQIERKHEDPQLFLVTYEGLHIHLRPHPQRKMHGLM